jgi:hypothetical protein
MVTASLLTPFAGNSPVEHPRKDNDGIRKSAFTWGNLIKNLLIITFLIGINKAGIAGNAVFYCVICVMAITSSQNAFKALSIGVLALVTNTFFVEKTVVFNVGRFALLLACFARIYYDVNRNGGIKVYRGTIIALATFVIVAGILSVINNYYLTVSLLKLANFAIGLYIIFGGVEILKRTNGEITCWMVSITLFVAIIGVASLALGVGYNAKAIEGVASSFFNGPFYHSNTLGPLAGMMVVYLLALACFTPYRLKWITWPIVIILFMFILMTKSRTATISCLAATGVMFAAAWMLPNRNGLSIRFNISGAKLALGGFVFAMLILLGFAAKAEQIKEVVQSFIVKNEGAAGFYVDEILASRQGQIDMTLYNFTSSPLIGIGFGTATTRQFQEDATWYSAPTEKGNLVLALLEETGVLGFLSFVVFLAIFVVTLWKNLNVVAIGVFSVFLIINMGEMMFFSFGGHGAYAWIFVGAALALGDRCVVRSSA